MLPSWKAEVVRYSWERLGVGGEGRGTPEGGDSAELPPLTECCWQGSGSGPSPAAHPSSQAVFSPFLPGSAPTARRRCTAINYSTTAPGEVSEEEGEGETLLNLHPACAPLLHLQMCAGRG